MNDIYIYVFATLCKIDNKVTQFLSKLLVFKQKHIA